MPDFLKDHYDTEGPFGLPMKDKQARALEERLKQLPPGLEPGRLQLAGPPTELLTGERADVSWISTEDIDRDGEIVLSSGMDDSHFQLNPIVTLNHSWWQPPVGRSLWRKKVKDGERRGIKAKTHYPPRPDGWPAGKDWDPDAAFGLVKAGLLLGKSIGFLPLKVRSPEPPEVVKQPELAKVRRIVEEWLLLEYSCVYIPAQQHAVVEAVSKGIVISSFTALAEVEKMLRGRLQGLDVTAVVCGALARARGRV